MYGEVIVSATIDVVSTVVSTGWERIRGPVRYVGDE